MSASSPTQIDVIANAIVEFEGGLTNDLAEHVVSALSDAGYTIMPAEEAWTLSRAQSLAFGTERMDSGDVEYSRGYNTAVDSFRDILRVADVEGERP